MAEDNSALNTAVNIAVLQAKIVALENRLTVSEQHTANLVKDRDNAVKWGLMTLGGAVLSMATWIFHLITNAALPIAK